MEEVCQDILDQSRPLGEQLALQAMLAVASAFLYRFALVALAVARQACKHLFAKSRACLLQRLAQIQMSLGPRTCQVFDLSENTPFSLWQGSAEHVQMRLCCQ